MPNYKLGIWVLLILLLTACGNQSTEQIYTYLEKAVELEEPFQQQQEPLQEAEKKEFQWYEEAITLGMDEFEKVLSLSDEALASIDEREKMIMIEKESIERSFEEFNKIKLEFENIEDETILSDLEKLTETMENRYEAYQDLFDIYNQTIEEDRKLYTLLKDEDLDISTLQSQINTVNEQYELVMNSKENFNKLTDSYNEQKKLFYESVGLDVHYQ
ncbi:YkyA family protein [Bacillus solitudinis]|uniref:YkyA family protein n=1 Tax=Bacillus solitudinis TaxID=2014074 RepID=UPI000C233F14|nr:YkyA family protein [Bacillus solitudinis]